MRLTPWWLDAAKVHVLVEDELTQTMLSTAWADTAVRVDAVGGSDAVNALVTDARKRGADTVFGVVDRDFNVSAGWYGEGSLYRLERHEAENYLLDFETLAAIARVPRQVIEAEAAKFSNAFTAYMAARSVLREVSLGLTEHFPPSPSIPSVQTPFGLPDAIAHVQATKFWSGLRYGLNVRWASGSLSTSVAQRDCLYTSEAQNGKWIDTFSGKEVFRHLRGSFKRLSAPDETIAKKVARRWQKQGSAPNELTTLCAELKRKVGI